MQLEEKLHKGRFVVSDPLFDASGLKQLLKRIDVSRMLDAARIRERITGHG